MVKTQKLDLLLSLYIASLVCVELLGGKIFTLWHVNASVAIFIYPLTFVINDMVTEVYGKDRAKSFVKSGFIVLILLFAFTTLATVLPPAGRFQQANPAYVTVFQQSQRIIIASLISFWLSEQFDVYIFAKIRDIFGFHRLWLRANVSNIVGELVDTICFMFLAFYTPGSAGFIVSLIIPYWILKCVVSIVHTPVTYLGVKWLKLGLE
jgi:uncharacterized integral membrane protein (TIGR00697 family)